MILQGDDRLQVITEKTWTDGSGRKLNLAPEWKDATEYARDESGQVIIYSYWNGKTGPGADAISPEAYQELSGPAKKEYQPCFEYKVPTGIPGTQGRTRGNNVYFQILRLSTSTDARLLASRYHDMVDVLGAVRPNFLAYENRGGDARAFRESSRNLLLRNFRLHEYEYDIYFPDETQGNVVYSEVKESAESIFEGTLYLRGWDAKRKARGAATIRMYDAGKYHGLGQSMMKLEITLRAAAFKRAGVTIRDMTFQEDCLAVLRGEVMAEMLKLRGGDELRKVQFEIFRNDNVLARIVRLEAGQSGLEAEVKAIKKQLAAMRAERVQE